MSSREPRKHHYVPVFYQKHFTNNDGLLWVYDRQNRTCKRLSPKVVCCENDFYTIFRKDGTRVRTLETEFTQPLDTLAAVSLQRLSSERHLDADSVDRLALFIGFQRTRVPSFRRMILAAYEATIEQTMLLGFSDVERAKKILSSYEKTTGDTLGTTVEELVEAVQSGGIRIRATETGFLEQMILQSKNIGEFIRRYEWCIVEAPTDSGFITSDDPLVTVPPSNYLGEDVGIATPGSRTYFALTRRYCLDLDTFGRNIRFRKIGAYATRQINKNIAANSDRFVLGPDEAQLRLSVEKSGSAAAEPDRVRIDIPERTADGALMRARTYRRRYFYY